MKTDEGVLSSGAKRSERASERAPRLIVDNQSRDVVIRRLNKILDDLVLGMRNLRALRPEPHDLHARLLKQAAKIRSVRTKLGNVHQMRLL
jgi:hypothetical protein